MAEPTPTPRINPQTDAVEIVLIDPDTGAVVGTVTAGEEPAPGERPLLPVEAEDDARWDPFRGRARE